MMASTAGIMIISSNTSTSNPFLVAKVTTLTTDVLRPMKEHGYLKFFLAILNEDEPKKYVYPARPVQRIVRQFA